MSLDHSRWIGARPNFLFPVRALSQVFRRKFLGLLQQAYEKGKIPAANIEIKASRIRRFLLHVLPEGFMRIRHFGFLTNRSKKQLLPQCRKLLDLDPALPDCPSESAKGLLLKLTRVDLSRCPSCQKRTMIVCRGSAPYV